MPTNPDEQARIDALLQRIRNGEPCNADALRSALTLLESALNHPGLDMPARISRAGDREYVQAGHVWREDEPGRIVDEPDWDALRHLSDTAAHGVRRKPKPGHVWREDACPAPTFCPWCQQSETKPGTEPCPTCGRPTKHDATEGG